MCCQKGLSAKGQWSRDLRQPWGSFENKHSSSTSHGILGAAETTYPQRSQEKMCKLLFFPVRHQWAICTPSMWQRRPASFMSSTLCTCLPGTGLTGSSLAAPPDGLSDCEASGCWVFCFLGLGRPVKYGTPFLRSC